MAKQVGGFVPHAPDGSVRGTITPLTPEQAAYLRAQSAPPPALPGNIPGFGPVFGGFGQTSPSGVPVFLTIGGDMRAIIPPGGFAGFAQQTPATQQLFARASGRRGGRTTQRRRRAKAKAAGAPRRRRAASRRPARLVKGSAAAKRYMASIRRKRRR